MGDYLPFCETVVMPDPLPQVPDCRDPFDTPFLLLAITGKADYLVTGDRDLLEISEKFSCPIVNAEQFFVINDLG